VPSAPAAALPAEQIIARRFAWPSRPGLTPSPATLQD